MMALACAIILLSLAALALAMDRHAAHRPHSMAGHRWRWALQTLGCAGLAASLACSLAAMDGILAIATWFGLLAPGTLCVAIAMALAGHRHRLRAPAVRIAGGRRSRHAAR